MSVLSNIFSNIFGNGKSGGSQSTSDKGNVDIDKLCQRLDTILRPRQVLHLEPRAASGANVFDSKLGGVPYMPKDFDYPKQISSDGMPLRLLAQLNFSRLPHIGGFPTHGILQIFCASDPDDPSYGCDFEAEDRCAQASFRVIYHENIVDDVNLLMSEADMPAFSDDCEFPLDGTFLLEPSKTELSHASWNDCRLEPALLKCLDEMYGIRADSLYDIDKTLRDAIRLRLTSAGTHVGGYPYFTQDDPRFDDRYAQHEVLLLQIDSHKGDNGSYDIHWGDNGVANFFIRPDDLAAKHFDRVLYNWDCH